ncbi:hypothetical protein H5410_019049 [Solanum commersonii]|uniref:Uncharacterized protein n=1 Tax=Solanum commersonii TaxID=4109 RepID=A0A9J6A3V9_SOLCO|nr:hypothetical protein H5410_019049 [Solanum commersonii]
MFIFLSKFVYKPIHQQYPAVYNTSTHTRPRPLRVFFLAASANVSRSPKRPHSLISSGSRINPANLEKSRDSDPSAAAPNGACSSHHLVVSFFPTFHGVPEQIQIPFFPSSGIFPSFYCFLEKSFLNSKIFPSPNFTSKDIDILDIKNDSNGFIGIKAFGFWNSEDSPTKLCCGSGGCFIVKLVVPVAALEKFDPVFKYVNLHWINFVSILAFKESTSTINSSDSNITCEPGPHVAMMKREPGSHIDVMKPCVFAPITIALKMMNFMNMQ